MSRPVTVRDGDNPVVHLLLRTRNSSGVPFHHTRCGLMFRMFEHVDVSNEAPTCMACIATNDKEKF